jgi:beta-glucuronidase
MAAGEPGAEAGLFGPVMLYTLPQTHIADVTVVTGRADNLHKVNGTVEISARLNQPIDGLATVTLGLDQHILKTAMAFKGGEAAAKIFVPSPMFWSPDEPHLYDLTIATEFDRCTLLIGIRTVEVSDGQVLLNGEPITLTGFELDSGRDVTLPELVRLFGHMRAEGANSLRIGTSPLSDHALQLADQMGLMIIADLPSDPAQLAARLAHDKNHPSVIG